MKMKKELNIAVQNLYDVFSIYHLDAKRLKEHSCPCCVTDEEIREIVVKPLRQLSEDELGHFSKSAISTFGCVEDYKHYLPRILELLQYPKSEFLFDFTCFEKLNYSEWETWPMEEQNAIGNYFMTLWSTIINDKNATCYQFDGVLSILIKYRYLDKALFEWTKSKTLKSIFFIVEGVLNGFNFSVNGEDYHKLSAWLTSEMMLIKVEEIFLKTEDKELANRIVMAYTVLENKYPLTFY